MSERFKKYDESSGEYGKEAEREVGAWLSRKYRGQIYHLPFGQYGIDLGDASGEIIIDVERRLDAWNGNVFRYKTLHVPNRRMRRLKGKSRWIVIQTNHEITKAYAIFWYSAVQSRLREVPNRAVPDGERMADIPLDEGLILDLTTRDGNSLEKLNCERIRAALSKTKNDAKGRERKRILLGSEPPFGMLYDEWKSLKLDVDKPVVQQMLFLSPPRFTEPYL